MVALAMVVGLLTAQARDVKEALLPVVALPPSLGARLDEEQLAFTVTALTGSVHHAPKEDWLSTFEFGLSVGSKRKVELLGRACVFRAARLGEAVFLGAGPTFVFNGLELWRFSGGAAGVLEVRLGAFALRVLASVEVSSTFSPAGSLSVALAPQTP